MAAAGPAAPPPSEPIAVLAAGAIVACSTSARAEGVRRGQRRRDAQARCPRLTVVAADPVATPADWEPGDDVIIGLGVSDVQAQRRFPGYRTVTPYLRTTPSPRLG